MSSNIRGKQLFISYSSSDIDFANNLCLILEENGVNCWIAPRDIRPGCYWDEEISYAADECSGLALLLSENSNRSDIVAKEVALFASRGKAIFPLRIEPVILSKRLELHCSSLHWIDLKEEELPQCAIMLVDSIKQKLCISDSVSNQTVSSGQYVQSSLPFSSNPIGNMISSEISYSNAIARLGICPLTYHREVLIQKGLIALRNGKFQGILLQGLPGCGKTTLMVEIAQEVKSDFDIFISFRFSGQREIDPSFFIYELNKCLKCIGREIDTAGIQKADFRIILQNLVSRLSDQKVLLLLDSVDMAPLGVIDTLLSALPVAPHVRTIMTAQLRVTGKLGATAIDVPQLLIEETEELIHLFSDLTGIEIDVSDFITKLPKYVVCNPSALMVVLRNLIDIPLEFLLPDNLPEESRVAFEMNKHIIESLTSEEKDLLCLIAFFDDVKLISVREALLITFPINFGQLIGKLVDRSLITRTGDSFYVASIVWDGLVEVCGDRIQSIAQKLATAVESSTQKIQRLNSDEADNLALPICAVIHKLHELKMWDLLITLTCEKFLETLNIRGFWKEYWYILRLLFDSYRSSGNLLAGAGIGFRILRKAFQMKDEALGKKILQELSQVILIEDSLNYAELLSHTALYTERSVNPEQALKELEESCRIREKLGDSIGLAIVKKLIGNIYLRKGEFTKASEYYKESLGLLEKLQDEFKQSLETETSLALCDLMSGHVEVAENRLREVIEMCHRTGYMAGLPRAYYHLVLVMNQLGRFLEGVHYAELAIIEAKKTFSDIAIAANLLLSFCQQKIVHEGEEK